MSASVAKPKGKPRTVGRKRQPPDPTSQEWWAKLGRLIERKKSEMTTDAIAKKAGISRTYLSLILAGEKENASYLTVKAILKAIDASFAELDRA